MADPLFDKGQLVKALLDTNPFTNPEAAARTMERAANALLDMPSASVEQPMVYWSERDDNGEWQHYRATPEHAGKVMTERFAGRTAPLGPDNCLPSTERERKIDPLSGPHELVRESRRFLLKAWEMSGEGALGPLSNLLTNIDHWLQGTRPSAPNAVVEPPHGWWSFLRSVLSQGASIQQDYVAGTHKGYEEYSARLDAAARERAEEIEAVLSHGKQQP